MEDFEEFDDQLTKRQKKRKKKMIIIIGNGAEMPDFTEEDNAPDGRRARSRKRDRSCSKPTSKTNGKQGH